MMFSVGMKVVCVDPGGWPVLSQGAIYTISKFSQTGSETYIGLVEVMNGDTGWYVRRFRPIVSRKTDISFAHEILRSASHKELT